MRMSLRHDLTRIKDGELLPPEEIRAMVDLAYQAGMGEITERNAEEFYVRVRMITGTFGGLITWETVQKYIGLHTNVTTLTDPRFNREFINRFRAKIWEDM
jgi:hypothetical protein